MKTKVYVIIERAADCAGVYGVYKNKDAALKELKRLKVKYGNIYTIDAMELL